MGKEIKVVQMEELIKLIKAQTGEFIIHMELGERGSHGNTESVST